LFLATPRHERARQSRAKQGHGHGLRYCCRRRAGGIDPDAPSLGACVAPVGQICGKEHAIVIGDKIVGAEAADPVQGEKQIAKIAAARAVTGGVINRDPKVAKVRVAAAKRVEAQSFLNNAVMRAAVGLVAAGRSREADAQGTRTG